MLCQSKNISLPVLDLKELHNTIHGTITFSYTQYIEQNYSFYFTYTFQTVPTETVRLQDEKSCETYPVGMSSCTETCRLLACGSVSIIIVFIIRKVKNMLD